MKYNIPSITKESKDSLEISIYHEMFFYANAFHSILCIEHSSKDKKEDWVASLSVETHKSMLIAISFVVDNELCC